jgi:O-antigen biosynthesis protein
MKTPVTENDPISPIFIVGPEGAQTEFLINRLHRAGLRGSTQSDPIFSAHSFDKPNPFDKLCDRFLPALLEQNAGPADTVNDVDPELGQRLREAIVLATAAHLRSASPAGRWMVGCHRLLFFLPFLVERYPNMILVQLLCDDPDALAPAGLLTGLPGWRQERDDDRRPDADGANDPAPAQSWAQAHAEAAAFARATLGLRHHVFRMDELSANPDACSSRLLDALGLPEPPAPDQTDKTTHRPTEWSEFDAALERALVRPLAADEPIALYQTWIDRIELSSQARTVENGMAQNAEIEMAVVLSQMPDSTGPRNPILSLAKQPGSDTLTLVSDSADTKKWTWPGRVVEIEGSLSGSSTEWISRLVSETDAEWYLFFEANADLSDTFLSIVRAVVDRNPQAAFLHSDFDELHPNGERRNPVMKPSAWDDDLHLQCNQLRGWFAVKRALIDQLEISASDVAEAALYELGLMASERAEPDAIIHVPHVLAHLPPKWSSDDERVSQAYEAVRRRALARRGWHAELEAGASRLIHHMKFPVPVPMPKVSVIVPTRDGGALLAQCLNGLQFGTDYEALEIIVVDNGSRDPGTLSIIGGLADDPSCLVIRHDQPFNFSEIMNLAVSHATGSLICMLNDDICVLHSGWLKEMVGLALRPDVGIVGALLLFENGTVQHAGVTLGLLGHVAGHDFHYEPETRMRRHQRFGLVHQTSAVTAACAVLRRQTYDLVGGMDAEHLAVNYNDLDLCLKIGAQGLKVLWTPYARLLHAESATRGKENLSQKMTRSNAEGGFIASKWAPQTKGDPFGNRNLSLETTAFELSFILSGRPTSDQPHHYLDREQLLVDAKEIARTAGILPDVLAFHAAKAAHHLGLDDLAASLTLEAVVQVPEAYTANLVAGSCLAKIGDLQRAYTFYRNANLISPQAIRPWLYRGLLAELLGRVDEAIDMLSVTLRHDPFNPRALAALERLSPGRMKAEPAPDHR